MKFHVTRDQKAGFSISKLHSGKYFRFGKYESQVIYSYVGNENSFQYFGDF